MARRTRDEDKTMTNGLSNRRRPLRLLFALTCLAVVLGACSMAPGAIITGGVPDDYRLRPPIGIKEGYHSIVVFVGHARGGLSITQRDDVIGLARMWIRE